MITASTVLKKINSYSFEDDKDGLLSTIIKSSAEDYAEGRLTRDEYEEILSDVKMEIDISERSQRERRLQNLYFVARVLLKVMG